MSFNFSELQNLEKVSAKNIKLKDLKSRVLIFLQKGLKSTEIRDPSSPRIIRDAEVAFLSPAGGRFPFWETLFEREVLVCNLDYHSSIWLVKRNLVPGTKFSAENLSPRQ